MYGHGHFILKNQIPILKNYDKQPLHLICFWFWATNWKERNKLKSMLNIFFYFISILCISIWQYIPSLSPPVKVLPSVFINTNPFNYSTNTITCPMALLKLDIPRRMNVVNRHKWCRKYTIYLKLYSDSS